MRVEVESWPREFRRELIIGDPQKPVAVCSLWSERKYVAGQIGVRDVAVTGNLFSHGPGIEGIIRNILANPNIGVIFVVGRDKSGSAGTLINFFNVGVDKTELGWTIPPPDDISEEDLPKGKRTIDGAIPKEAIVNVRENVEIADLRGRGWTEIRDLISGYEEKPPFAEPAVYPKTESKVSRMQGEDVGFIFRGDKPEEVWLNILRTIRRFGNKAESRYTSSTQELLNIMAVLDGDLTKMMKWPGWVGNSPSAVRKYSEQLINGVRLDEEDTYAYGERMRVKKGDQIGALIHKLGTDPNDRGYVINLWDVNRDFMAESSSPPCLTQVWFRVYRGRLSATFSYRSHDMYGAWIKNVMGDRLLQAYIAAEAGLPLGPTTIVSESAHIYEHDFAQVDGLLEHNRPRWKFTEDPRGNIIINVEDGQIIVRHENDSGAVTVFCGTSAESLYKKLHEENLVLFPEHAMYIGSELMKAESCVREGKGFEQDKA